MSSELVQPETFQLPEQAAPLLVQLGLTYRCNLTCSHCYALYRRSKDEFTLDEIRDLADELYKAGACSLVYSHGENMIRRDFHEAAAIFRDLDFYQTLMLNGFYVQNSEDARNLIDAGINRCMVSIDSIDPSIHDEVRGKEGAFEHAQRAIDLLLAGGMETVGFSTTLDVHNYGDVDRVVDFAVERGVHAISFMQNRYNRTSIFDASLWPKYREVCTRLYELMLAHRGVLDIYTHDPFMLTLLDDRLEDNGERADFIGANLCNVGVSMVSIDPVGNVSGCNFIEEAIGNVRKEPFWDIWERLCDRYSDRRDPPSGPCSSCSVKSACVGGCKAFHYNGKYDQRCGSQRFNEAAPHQLTGVTTEIPDRDPSTPAGVFLGSTIPRIRTDVSSSAGGGQ